MSRRLQGKTPEISVQQVQQREKRAQRQAKRARVAAAAAKVSEAAAAMLGLGSERCSPKIFSLKN